ncbi:hypothetical protein EYR36_005206 [Pleurotus pulmonarius]|nr:hypothetical protein EYR36_005206 [Pleurotus pulmonarius]
MDNPSTSSTPVTAAEQAGWQEIEEITRKLTEEFRIKDQTSKSRGYEISGMTCVLSSAYEIPTDNPAVLYTSQPRGSDYAVEFLLHGAAAKRELIEYPDYPQEPYRPSELKERPYSIVEISGKGLGMVATKDLAPGDLIVAERPLLVAPRLLRTLGSVVFHDNATKEQQEAAKSFETEKTIRYAYDRMRPEDQAAYMKLHNAHLHDGSGPLFGIMRTNRYALFDLQGETYTGVFEDLSRINHSCCPNADRRFNRATLSMQLFAARNIKKGEQITTSYCDLLAPYATRQLSLAPYGIRCDCPACLDHVESDKNRLRISRLQSAVPAIIKWAANPALPDDLLLRPSLTMLELLESEGLEATRHYAQVLYHSMLIYSALGESSTNECLHFMARCIATTPAPESPRGTDGMANSANAKESKEEIFRKMEETAHRLMEEYEFVDATTPTIARGYTRAHGDYAFRVVPTGEPIPDATFVSAVYSTQPQGCDPAAGTAECILHSSAAKRELLAYPGYPTPLPHAPGGAGAAQACPPYRIVNIPHKGLGMVAARDLAFGEVITNERPLLVAPQYILLDFIRWLRAPSGWENQQVALFETQRFYRMAYERMRGEDKVAYLQLYNAHAHDGSGPLLGVQRTNSFLMFELQDTMKILINGLLSSISCSPNTIRRIDRTSLSMQMFAARSIKAGEEITSSYCDPLLPSAARQAKLAPYGVRCTCSGCLKPVESDKNRHRINSTKDAVPAIIQWAGSPGLPEGLLLGPSVEVLRLIEAEGQEANEVHERVLYHLALIHDALELMGAPRPEGAGYRGKWMQLTALDRARSFRALAKYKEDREKRKMAAKVEKTNEEIFRQMEETSIKLMEEFKIQDSTSKSRGYICGGGFTYKLVPVGQPAPDDDSLVYTTQPQGCDPEAGMVECVLQNSAAKKELVEYPGYPAPIPREADSPASCPYRIVEIPSKGLGMVAARDLHFGELIISERPLMITPQRTIHSIKWMDSATPRQKQEAVYFESEKIHKVALERMEPEDKEAYMQLYNSHKHDGSGPIVGISRTNAYGVFALQGDEYGGVFKDASRINHSCSPNTFRHFDRLSLSMQMYAVREIKEGEEITAHYCDPLSPYAARRKALKPYGIRCDCPACLNPAKSDKIRYRISCVKDAIPAIVKWAGNPKLPDDLLLGPSLELLKLMEDEGLQASKAYERVLYHLFLIYSALTIIGTYELSEMNIYQHKWIQLQTFRLCTREDACVQLLTDAMQVGFAAQRRSEVTMKDEPKCD